MHRLLYGTRREMQKMGRLVNEEMRKMSCSEVEHGG